MKKATKKLKTIKPPPPANLRNVLEISLMREWKNINENPYPHVRVTRVANTVIEALSKIAGLSQTFSWPHTEAKLAARLSGTGMIKPKGFQMVDLVNLTWDMAYPERRPWDKIGAEAQEEWRRVFAIYETLLLK
jgi:hypothetical protein